MILKPTYLPSIIGISVQYLFVELVGGYQAYSQIIMTLTSLLWLVATHVIMETPKVIILYFTLKLILNLKVELIISKNVLPCKRLHLPKTTLIGTTWNNYTLLSTFYLSVLYQIINAEFLAFTNAINALTRQNNVDSKCLSKV